MQSTRVTSIVLLVMSLGLTATVWGQIPTTNTSVDQERARRLSATPLDDKAVQYEFDMGSEGAGIAVTAVVSDAEVSDHIGWRVHRLAMDAARCDFSAPELNVASSPEARALCDPRPKLRVVSHALLNGSSFEIGASTPELVPQIQQLVGRIAQRHSKGVVVESPDPHSAGQIAELEDRWAKAAATGDAAAVEPLLSGNFVTTDVSGHSYNKKELLATLKGGRWESNGISDVKVTVYGDTAIATGAWAGKGVDGDGTRIDRHERWTDTWIKTKGGKWQCVASHASEVK